MPMVPGSFNPSGYSPSIMDNSPSRTNLLMAAADYARGLEDEPRSAPQGPERPRLAYKRKANRPLRVIK